MKLSIYFQCFFVAAFTIGFNVCPALSQENLRDNQPSQRLSDTMDIKLAKENTVACAVIVRRESDIKYGSGSSNFDAYLTEHDGVHMMGGTELERNSFSDCIVAKSLNLSQPQQPENQQQASSGQVACLSMISVEHDLYKRNPHITPSEVFATLNSLWPKIEAQAPICQPAQPCMSVQGISQFIVKQNPDISSQALSAALDRFKPQLELQSKYGCTDR